MNTGANAKLQVLIFLRFRNMRWWVIKSTNAQLNTNAKYKHKCSMSTSAQLLQALLGAGFLRYVINS